MLLNVRKHEKPDPPALFVLRSVQPFDCYSLALLNLSPRIFFKKALFGKMNHGLASLDVPYSYYIIESNLSE